MGFEKEEEPFNKKNIDLLGLQTDMAFFICSANFDRIMKIIHKDSKRIIFPSTGEIMHETYALALKFKQLGTADKSTPESLLKVKEGFDELKVETREMYKRVNKIFNELGKKYYPDDELFTKENGKSK